MSFDSDYCSFGTIFRPRVLYFLSITAYLFCGGALIIIGTVYEFDSYLQQQMAIDNLALPTKLLIPIGCFVVLISFLSCHGGKKGDPLLLLIYASIAGLLLMFTMGCFIMILANYNGLSEQFLLKMQENQDNYDTDSNAQLYWDGFHVAHQCCGIYKTSEWLKYDQKVPYSCCQSYREQDENVNMYCAEESRGKPYLRVIGCLAKLESAYGKYRTVMLCACISTTAVQIECIVMAVYIAALFWKMQQEIKAALELQYESDQLVKSSTIIEEEEEEEELHDNDSSKANYSKY